MEVGDDYRLGVGGAQGAELDHQRCPGAGVGGAGDVELVGLRDVSVSMVYLEGGIRTRSAARQLKASTIALSLIEVPLIMVAGWCCEWVFR